MSTKVALIAHLSVLRDCHGETNEGSHLFSQFCIVSQLFCSDVVLGEPLRARSDHHVLKIVVFGVNICHGGASLQVGTVPSCKLVQAGLAKRARHIASRVVCPDLANVQVLNENDWVTTPELLSWDESSRGHDATRSKLSSFLDASSLQHHRLVTNNDIVLNLTRVECGACSDRAIVTDRSGCRHASRQSSSRVDNTVVTNRGEVSNSNNKQHPAEKSLETCN